MSHKANYTYMRMALGLPFQYAEETGEADREAIFDNKQPATVEYVWTGQELVGEICKAWGISRERFIKSMAAPKPSPIAHLIFNDELQKCCGETIRDWPNGRGLIIPKWINGQMERIDFHPLHEILKPKRKLAA